MKGPINLGLHNVNGVLDAKSQPKGNGQQCDHDRGCEDYSAVEPAHCDTHHACLETQRHFHAQQNEQGEDRASNGRCVVPSMDSREVSTEDGVRFRERASKVEG